MSRGLSPVVTAVGGALVKSAGGYLRNTIRQPLVTCSVCTTPVDGYPRCYQCKEHVQSGLAIADRVATVVYARERSPSGERDQTYIAMYGYKAPRPQQTHVSVVGSLLALAVLGHTECDLKLSRSSSTYRWATVPSTRDPAREHPLHALAASLFRPGFEVRVRAQPGFAKARSLQPDGYEVLDPVPDNGHVVVIDDSWVSGGSAQSVAVAVREAGAQSVSILAIARILNLSFDSTAEFLRAGRLAADFDPTVCPWTGAACP